LGLVAKIEGLGKIWEGLVSNKLLNVSVSKEKVSFTSLVLLLTPQSNTKLKHSKQVFVIIQ